MRKRRLSTAAELLTETDLKVLEIALRCGFGSHEAFTRAFRKMYGILPTECRKLGRPPFLVPRAAPLPTIETQITSDWGDQIMQYRIEQLPAMRILGCAMQSTIVEGKNHDDIPAFWQTYMQERLGERIPGKKIQTSSLAFAPLPTKTEPSNISSALKWTKRPRFRRA